MIKLLLLFLLLCCSVRAQTAQTLSQGVPEEHVGTPRAKPEPRKKFSKDPMELFNGTLQNDTQLRLDSLEELFAPSDQLEDFPEDFELRRIPDVQIRYLQLDDDPEPEVVIIAHLNSNKTHIAIVDHAPDGWYRIGHFEYWYYAFPEDAESAIEFHFPFILFREKTGGSGYLATEVSVYRMWKGCLYKTFEADEAEEGGWQGINSISTIQFRSLSHMPPPWMGIVVRTDEHIEYQSGPTPEPVHKPVSKKTCNGFEWTPKTFSFEPTPRATTELCKPESAPRSR